MEIQKDVPDADTMRTVGSQLSQHLKPGHTLYLSGPLGAGKTTFAQGVLNGLGHQGYAKSPTYALVETYALNGQTVHHFDCYRLSSKTALEEMGLSDYLDNDAICLIEWPENGEGRLPEPTIYCTIEIHGGSRQLRAVAASNAGMAILQKW